jgi:hypothetical protein
MLRFRRSRCSRIGSVHNEFMAIVEQDGDWFISYCAEVPGANGQGRTREECLANLREAMALFQDLRSGKSYRSAG